MNRKQCFKCGTLVSGELSSIRKGETHYYCARHFKEIMKDSSGVKIIEKEGPKNHGN